MNRIAAKPTLYKGIRFRSRLEARWAVFFDALGLEWGYEPTVEGSNGYMPDFRLGDAYVEIKPRSWAPTGSDPWTTTARNDHDRYEAFTRSLGKTLFVFIGEPGRWDGGVRVSGAGGLRIAPGEHPAQVWWEECGRCSALTLVDLGKRVCKCNQEYRQLDAAFSAVRDASYEDAP